MILFEIPTLGLELALASPMNSGDQRTGGTSVACIAAIIDAGYCRASLEQSDVIDI